MDIDDTQEEDETRASLTLCAICHFTLAEPCTLMCGHNFDRRCLRRHLAHAAAHPSCPLCRAPTHPLHLPPVNTMLKALIALSYPDAHLKRGPPARRSSAALPARASLTKSSRCSRRRAPQTRRTRATA